MKRKSFFIFSIIFFIICVSGCSSLGKAEADEPEQPEKQFASEDQVVLPDGWKYETEITHEGSRSEGSVSRLFYRYTEIPSVYERIIISNTVFEYVSMVNAWDNWGYIETGVDEQLPQSSGAIMQEEIKRGWYLANYFEKKAGTPKNWVWAGSGAFSAWISPALLVDFAELHNLKNAGSGPQLLRSE